MNATRKNSETSPTNNINSGLANQKLITELNPTQEGQSSRLAVLEKATNHTITQLTNPQTISNPQVFKGNIENYIGITQIPTGIAGPLTLKGDHAKGQFYIPLATTEGALVASYNRGINAISLAGGATVKITKEAISRCPAFRFKNATEASEYSKFIQNISPYHLQQIVSAKSNYAELTEIKPILIGNLLIVCFSYTTGDAAGQNMVTICTDAICKYILHYAPIKPTHFYIESNLSGDKKATAFNFTGTRGKNLIAEVVIPAPIVRKILKSTPQAMCDYYECANIAANYSGALGSQGHFANALTALFIATGNDPACVAESSVGNSHFKLTTNGDLYVSANLPCFVAGTVGGGTSLPTQSEALKIMDCQGPGKAAKFAEIAAGLVLAGEISINAAIAEGHFTDAHSTLGRK